MTLQQVDEVLRVWKTRLAAIAENLLELQSEGAYRTLTGTGGLDETPVTGVTAVRVKPALAAVQTMFEQFGLLQATVDRAERLRKELPAFFGGEAKARELEQVLFGRSIEIAGGNVPLEQRTLLGGMRSAERVTPEELLEPMTRTFAAARDAVMSVERAWTEFADNSARVEAEIARLRAQKAMPSALLASSLEAVEGEMEAVRAHVQTDPLGAEGELRAQVEPKLAEVARRVDAAMQLGAQLRSARVRWEDLLRVHGEASAAVREARERVADGAEGPVLVGEDKVRGLGEWLVRLEHKREEGALEAVAVGLRHWNTAVEACVGQDTKVQQGARAQVEQRSELRGRLDALKAKARRYGVAERHEMSELSGEAEALLYQRPADLVGAASAVARYEQRLRASKGEA